MWSGFPGRPFVSPEAGFPSPSRLAPIVELRRLTHGPDLKARVAMEAIGGRKAIQEIAPDHAVHPIHDSQCTARYSMESATCLPDATRPRAIRGDKRCRLNCLIRSGNSRSSWSCSKKYLSCSNSRELRNLLDHDHLELTVSRHCVLMGLSQLAIPEHHLSSYEELLGPTSQALGTGKCPAIAVEIGSAGAFPLPLVAAEPQAQANGWIPISYLYVPVEQEFQQRHQARLQSLLHQALLP